MAECVKAQARPVVSIGTPYHRTVNDFRRRAWECAWVLRDRADLNIQQRVLVETTLLGAPERVPVRDAGELLIAAIRAEWPA